MTRGISLLWRFLAFVTVFLCLGIWCCPSFAAGGIKNDGKFTLTGYARTWVSMNLEDPPESQNNDRYGLSMVRGSVLLDAEGQTGGITLKGIARFDGEIKTSYLKHLETEIDYQMGYVVDNIIGMLDGLNQMYGVDSRAANTYRPIQGDGHDIMDQYNNAELREYWIEFKPQRRVTVRFGKQQVVWGETDFFRAMDVVHGFNYKWRSFLEPENEELRKPLILVNAMIQVPEADGSLQLILRPGWDEDDDIGNSNSFEGGRWEGQPIKGVDYTALVKFDYHHPKGDVRDITGGARWTGLLGPVEYSLAYLRTFNDDPIINTNPANCNYEEGNYSRKAPKGIVGDVIFPMIDLVGVTGNLYVPFIDAVLSTECVFTKDKPYNTGTDQYALHGQLINIFNAVGDGTIPMDDLTALLPTLPPSLVGYLMGAMPAYFANMAPGGSGFPGGFPTADQPLGLNLPGFTSIKEKDTLMLMFRVDKTSYFLEKILNTGKPPLVSVQFFDQWVLNWDRDDDITWFPAFGTHRKEHSIMLTAICMMSYKNESVNPQLALIWDPTYGGGAIIPSVQFVMGDHWRLRLEADLFLDAGTEKGYSDPLQIYNVGHETATFGTLAKSDQFLMRLTYQF